MLVQEIIDQVREQLHDITKEHGDKVLIKYINTAIKSASLNLAKVNSSMVLEEMEVVTGTVRPANFMRFAGIYPIKITGGKFIVYGTADPQIVRYYAYKPNVKAVSDEVPFDDEAVLLYIEQYTSILAMNRNEFDISNDVQILQNFREELLANAKVG